MDPSHVLDFGEMRNGDTPPPPPPQLLLNFTDLTYSVKNNQSGRAAAADDLIGISSTKTKLLLDNISGEAREGEILAVLGGSGSGKSTLIDALSNRMAKGSLKGSVTLNGEDLMAGRLLKVISAYVMQDDLLYPMLTVEETLMYSAEFRLPRSLSKQKQIRVQELIDQLGLRRAAKTIIGDEGHRGISGGERRRVSIGTDIIHDPIVLFLDEPTSGLDSASAFMVVNVLHEIARSGSIVIMSIHQPSFRILGLLDRLLFLSRGQTVYSGSPEGLPTFFAAFGRPIPQNENSTEFALDLVRELVTHGGTGSLVAFNKSWPAVAASQQPELHMSLKDAISASISCGKLVCGAVSSSSAVPQFANPFWTEIGVLTKRSFTNTRRQPLLFGMRLGAVMVTGFILATVYWQLDDSPKGVQERMGFFAIALSTIFFTCADALPVFLQERYIFMRETAYNAYRRSSYVLANSIVAIPALIFLSVCFATVTFFGVGLAGGAQGFLVFFLIVLASFWAGSGFVTFLSGVVSDQVIVGYTVVVAVLAYFLLFSGFFIQRDRIPYYWIWFHYLSLVKYPYEAMMQNEFGGDAGKCFVRGVQMFDNLPLGQLPDAIKMNALEAMSGVLGTNLRSSTCITTGRGILEQQAVTGLSKWSCLIITVAWGFFFRILFYVSLFFGSRNKRR